MAGERGLGGRVVALTGAGRGLGLLTVEALLERNARVVANYRSMAPELFRLTEKYPTSSNWSAETSGTRPPRRRSPTARSTDSGSSMYSSTTPRSAETSRWCGCRSRTGTR